ncbi:cation-transporting P-type ATPase, partial [bacterium]|nr:cation-transporting P-type ATPase [bacterium]
MQGLTSQEAERRHLAFGANEIVPRRLESRLLELRKALLDPLGLMLLGLALLYYSLGNRSDSFILLLAYIPVVGVDVLLDIKAQRVLKALQSTLQRNARVIRDGVPRLISIRKIVAGDVLVFDEGQTLAADGTILEAEHLGLNEAVLTGESLPAHKTSGDRFLAGTIVMQGRGLGLVTAIGASTQFGEIAILLHETKSSPTPLQEKLRRIIRKIFV